MTMKTTMTDLKILNCERELVGERGKEGRVRREAE